LKTPRSIRTVQTVGQNYRSPVLNLPKNIKLHKVLKKKHRRCLNRRHLLCLFITLLLLIICIVAIILILFLHKSSGTKQKKSQISLIYLFCSLVTCNPNCKNGGTCIAKNVCQCITDKWTGSYCQTRKQFQPISLRRISSLI